MQRRAVKAATERDMCGTGAAGPAMAINGVHDGNSLRQRSLRILDDGTAPPNLRR